MIKLKKRLLCIFAALVLSLAGCEAHEPVTETVSPSATPTPTPTSSPEVSPYPSYGGEITLSMRNPLTLNPILNEDASADEILRLIFEPVTIPGDNLKMVPNTAVIKSLDFYSDGISVLININENAVWSDETPVTADDLIFTLDALSTVSENAIYSEIGKNISGYSKITELSVKVSFENLSGQNSYFLNFPIIPKHYYEREIDPKSERNMSPLGNGAYKFESLTPMKNMVLTRSENTLKQTAYIETINVLFTPDYSTALDAFNQGIIDAITVDSSDYGVFRRKRQVNSYDYISTTFDFIGFNSKSEIFSDLNVRQAVAHAIPDDIAETIYLNNAVAAATPVNPESWLYEPNTVRYTYDLQKAKSLLGKPFPLTILVNEENEERIRIATIIKDNLTELGIGANVKSVPFNILEQMINDGDYDIFVGGLKLSLNSDLYFLLHSSGENFLGFSDEKMDSLLLLAHTAVNDLAAVKTSSDLQIYITETLPLIGIAFKKEYLLTDSSIYAPNPRFGDIYSNINEWYLFKQ